MDNPSNQALARLRDIHMPEPISQWPMAPGWYLLFGLFVGCLIVCAFLIFRKMRQRRPKKQAAKLLQRYQLEFKQSQNAQLASARVSEILKRVALAYYPRDKVAGLQGDEWISFLDKAGGKPTFSALRYELVELPFTKDASTSANKVKVEALFEAAGSWIKQRRKPCSS